MWAARLKKRRGLRWRQKDFFETVAIDCRTRLRSNRHLAQRENGAAQDHVTASVTTEELRQASAVSWCGTDPAPLPGIVFRHLFGENCAGCQEYSGMLDRISRDRLVMNSYTGNQTVVKRSVRW